MDGYEDCGKISWVGIEYVAALCYIIVQSVCKKCQSAVIYLVFVHRNLPACLPAQDLHDADDQLE